MPAARYWLNPAYGDRCVTIGDALKAYVWQQGCAVVALLPALLHADWYVGAWRFEPLARLRRRWRAARAGYCA